MEQMLIQQLTEYVSKYPWGVAILIGMGVLRVIFKPTFSYLRVIVDATPSSKDNALLDKAEGSVIYKALVWLVDYLGSVKLPGAK